MTYSMQQYKRIINQIYENHCSYIERSMAKLLINMTFTVRLITRSREICGSVLESANSNYTYDLILLHHEQKIVPIPSPVPIPLRLYLYEPQNQELQNI